MSYPLMPLPDTLNGTDTIVELPVTALFIFDWDGTLVRPKSGAKFPTDPYDYEPLPGRVDVIHQLCEFAFLGIATNQGGVAYGIHEHDALFMAIRTQALQWFNIPRIALCPHHPKGKLETGYAFECRCRKPKPGMLLDLMYLYRAKPQETLYVGDMDTDEQAARAAGCRYCDAGTFFAL